MVDIVWSGKDDLSYMDPTWIPPKVVVGLDRDGVLNENVEGYCIKPDQFKPIEGSLQAVAKLRKLGHKIAIITNQGCIEKGICSQEDVEAVNYHMLNLLGEAGCAAIDALYYSASSRKDDEWAKPNVGMFKRCERENPHIKFSKGYYVGDKISDLKAAVKIGAKPILVRTGHGKDTETELNKFTYRKLKKTTMIFDDLQSFVEWLS